MWGCGDVSVLGQDVGSCAPGAPFQRQNLFAPPPGPPPPRPAPIQGRGLNEPAGRVLSQCWIMGNIQRRVGQGTGGQGRGSAGRGQTMGRTGCPDDAGMEGGTCGIWGPKKAGKDQDAHAAWVPLPTL